MTLQEIELQILELSPIEKAALMQMLTQTFNRSTRGIIKTTGVCGGDACIGDTRIPVWSLVCDRRLGKHAGIIVCTEDIAILNDL